MNVKRKLVRGILLMLSVFVIAHVSTLSWLSKDETSGSAHMKIFDVDDRDNISTFRDVTGSKNEAGRRTSSLKTTSRTASPRGRIEYNLPLCAKPGENLVGHLKVDQTVPNLEDIEKSWDERSWVEKGGAWRPDYCQAVKVALIIPYRNRYQQLKIFLRHIHPVLKRQLLDYRIFVIEQNGKTPFNRAMLFNIGYNESLKYKNFQCFVFHDVDLIPENDRNYYGCPTSPLHMSVAVDKFNYKLPYNTLLGGAAAFRKKHFKKINGFSNRFWGWGGEDDDMYHRITEKNLNLTRPSAEHGRYKMLKKSHNSADVDPRRHEKLLNSQRRMMVDGLNSLKYDIVQTVECSLYTRITVDVHPKSYSFVR